MMYDIAIVGAGVTGAMTARALSKYNLKIALLEKCNDVAMGATKANSGIVHAGFDAAEGSLMAKMNVKGCAMMPETCRKLNVPYINNGSLVVAFSQEEDEHLKAGHIALIGLAKRILEQCIYILGFSAPEKM